MGHLRRVLAGMRGEQLAPDPDALRVERDEDGLMRVVDPGRKRKRGAYGTNGTTVNGAVAESEGSAATPSRLKGILKRRTGDIAAEEEEDAEDGEGKDPRENEDNLVAMRHREENNFVAQGRDVDMTVHTVGETADEGAADSPNAARDKEARKKAKKERRKSEKQDRENTRKSRVKAEGEGEDDVKTEDPAVKTETSNL